MRLIMATLRARRAVSVLLFVLAALAVAAGSAAPLYADSAERSVQRLVYETADGADRAISVRGTVFTSVGSDGPAALRDTLLTAVEGLGLTAVTGTELAGSTEGRAEASHVLLATRDDVCAHLRVRGRCATAAGEAVVSETAADTMDTKPGSALVIRAASAVKRVRLTVVGVYRPTDVVEPYWAGRSDLGADARREPAPVFVTSATLEAARPESVQARIDLIVSDPNRLSEEPAALIAAVDRVRAAAPAGATVRSGLPTLVERARFERRLLTSGIAIGVSQLVVLCCLVLLLAATAAASDRRAESALAVLRGARRRHWAALAVGPTAVTLLAASVVGYGTGWLGAWAARRWVFGDAEPPPASRASLLVAAATVVVVLIAAVGAEWLAHRGPLLDNLRRTPARRRRWWLAGSDLVAVALAGAATYQILAGTTTGGLAVAAPLLLALACGLLAGRLVLPVAAPAGVALLHRGRLAGALAALELARRPHARQLLSVITMAVALAGLAVCGVDTTGRAIGERAGMELGADRVLTVASGPAATRAAVHAADPDGRWAMAASRLRIGSHTLVAVESDRLAAIARWPDGAPDVGTVAAALKPAGNRPVTITAGELTLTVTVVDRLDLPARLTLRLFEPDGTARDAGTVIDQAPGRREYRIVVPDCAAGCRLGWLSFPSSPERLRLHGLRQRDGDGEREVLSPGDFAAPGRWRAGFTTVPGDLRLEHGDGWLTATYRPIDLRYIASELHLRLADSPVPLPVAVAGWRALGARELWLFGGGQRPVELVTSAAGLPGVAGDGYLFDHEYAERLAGDPGATSSGGEVWLVDGTPAEVVDRLRATLPVTGEETIGQRSDRLLDSGAGQSVRLYALAALLGVALAGGAVLTVATADRRRRGRELRDLRVQGLPGPVGARAGALGYAALAVGGLLAGVGAAAANWWAAHRLMPVFDPGWVATSPPDTPRPLVALAAVAGVAAVLLSCAWYAGHRFGGDRP